MDFIKNKKTGVISDASGDGYATVWKEKPGRIVNKYITSKAMWCPIFNPDGLDPVGNDVFADYQYDLSRHYLAMATDEEEEEVNCALFNFIEANPSRTFSNGINTFKIIPKSSSMVLEFATELDGITKAGSEIININYYQVPKESDGSYLVDVTADGTVQTILIRQQGCTSTIISPSLNDFNGGRFHAYITDDDGIIVEPPTGKIGVPIGAIMWDGHFEDYQLTPRNGLSGNPYERGINRTSALRVDFTEFAVLNLVPFYGQQNLTPEDIIILKTARIGSENVFTEIHKNVTCKLDRPQIAMDKEIGFALDAGIDYFCFNYYSPYDTPMGEGIVKFVASSAKSTMKMCFMGESLGYDIPLNVDYITNQMMQSFYQKIDGKPLLFTSELWLNLTHEGVNVLQLIKNSYSSKSGGGQLYVVYYSGGRDYPTDEGKFSTHGMSGSSIYVTWAEGDPTPRPHSKLMDDEISLRNSFVTNSNRDIIPVLTTGFLNLWKRSSLEGGDNSNYTEVATTTQIGTKMSNLIDFINSNPSRVKAMLFYAWNENSESGNPICPTLSNGTTSVDVAYLNVAGANIGVNRSTLDKVKEYCKKT